MKHSSYIYIAIFALFISSFPLALGWLPFGAYVPRFMFLLISVFLYPFVMKTKQFVFLCLYYLYVIFANFLVGKSVDFLGLSANFMEMGIPMIAMTAFISNNKAKDIKQMGVFSLIMTFATIFTSLYILTYVDSTAIRAMVGMMARGESTTPYLRMGVADYSMAAMVMAMPCVLIAFLKNHPITRRTRLFCLFGILVALWFMYKASVTTTLFICIIISLGSIVVKERQSLKRNVFSIFPVIIIIILFVLPFVLDTLSNVLNQEVAGRSAMVKNMWQGSSYDESEDLGTRIGLYQLSLKAFVESPFFGNASAIVGGHNYVLDRLGLYGLLGTLLHVLFVIYQCKLSYKIVPERYKIYYLIIILGVAMLAFLKNLSGFEYWTYMFLYYPCMLYWGEQSNNRFIIAKQ